MNIQSLLSFSLLLIAVVFAIRMRGRRRREFIIREGFAGLLYDHGNLVGTLVSGRHIRWGARYDLAVIDLRDIEPAQAAHGAPTACESGSVKVLFADRLLTVREVAAEIRKKSDPIDRLPKNSTLAGVPLRILLSERSSPGAFLRESLRIRPSQRDD
jgi:hypothetical protein